MGDHARQLGDKLLALRRNGPMTAAQIKPLVDEAEAAIAKDRRCKALLKVVNEVRFLLVAGKLEEAIERLRAETGT